MKLQELGSQIKSIQNEGTVLIVTDTNVAPLYLDEAVASIQAAGLEAETFIVPAGEASKTGAQYMELLEYASQIPLTRSDGIAALGGGMVGDLAGFTAATYLRGIHVYQVPTSLLAAVDSSVGGKTAIDLPQGKNLVGAFHQPSIVLQDAELLKTLPESIYRDGMAEVIKYGVINDAHLFDQLRDPSWTRENIADVIARCVEIKREYVEADEFDHGLRHMLNFGHTIGHAVEQLSNYTVSHGEAVAKGMLRMAEISANSGWCKESVVQDLREILTAYGFDLSISDSPEALYEKICSDKKRKGSTIKIVTPDSIGTCQIRPVAIDDMLDLLKL